MGRMGISKYWVLWFSTWTIAIIGQVWVFLAMPGQPNSLSPDSFASLQCIVCPISSSLGYQDSSTGCLCVFFPLYSHEPFGKLCLTHLHALSGDLHTVGIHQLQAEVNWIKPQQVIWQKGPPYLIQGDDPIGLIGRFPLDVDLLLKRPPLDGL